MVGRALGLVIGRIIRVATGRAALGAAPAFVAVVGGTVRQHRFLRTGGSRDTGDTGDSVRHLAMVRVPNARRAAHHDGERPGAVAVGSYSGCTC